MNRRLQDWAINLRNRSTGHRAISMHLQEGAQSLRSGMRTPQMSSRKISSCFLGARFHHSPVDSTLCFDERGHFKALPDDQVQ